MTAVASVQFFLPTDVDFRNARFAFIPLAAGWVGLALAAAESGRRLAWVAPAALALFAVDGAALAHPLHAAALEREMAGERPAARAEFDVHLMEESGRILYRREDCSESDAATEFFLIAFPANVNDLPKRMRESGAERLDFGGPFHFYREGDWEPVSPHDGRCAMERDLPIYPIASIWTGQTAAGGGELWGVTLAGDMRVPDSEPTARGGIFDLHRDGDRLIYAASDCSESDTRERFFLSIIPEDAADLSEYSKARGLDHNSFNFDFKRRGAVWDGGGCAAVAALPRYGIDAVETGQFVLGEGELWRVKMPDDGEVPDGAPATRGGVFDLHLVENRLIYAAERCAEGDTRGRFFLSVIPKDAADLSEDSRARGLGHDSFNFDFERHDKAADGECKTVRYLPEYAINAVETGQFAPGEGELWKVRLEVGY